MRLLNAQTGGAHHGQEPDNTVIQHLSTVKNKVELVQMPLGELLTGRPRPRHLRFAAAVSRLVPSVRQVKAWESKLFHASKAVRLWRKGMRVVDLPPDCPWIVHQAVCGRPVPYVAEFDVPLAIHGYSVSHHRRSASAARAILEHNSLRRLIVFSEWAKRSFQLHFGPEVGRKCAVVYPLASEKAHCGGDDRTYTFSFISTQFRIKAGPQVVRAFLRARERVGRDDARMCVVTSLREAAVSLGGRLIYGQGIEWREACLDEGKISELLADTICLVHPSLADSFGVVVLEALAAGCAVVTTDIASFPEMVEPGVNGVLLAAPLAAVTGDAFITEYGDADYFARYLDTLSLHELEERLEEVFVELLEKEDKARAWGRASRSLFERRFAEPVWRRTLSGLLAEAFPEFRRGALKP